LSNSNLVYDNSFNFWTLAMGVTQFTALKFFIGAGWILWEVAILAFGIITISRYLLAQSLDRFLPSRFAYVSEKWNSPVFAHLFDLVVTVALIGPWSTFSSSGSGPRSTDCGRRGAARG
jgi:amino acid transporter